MSLRNLSRRLLRSAVTRPRHAPPKRPLAVSTLEDRVNPAPIQFFYIPMPEASVNAAFDTIITNTTISATQESITAITVTESNSRIWYDQWEDGYEANLGNPQQATTQLWGDGDNANGIAPGFANDPVGLPSGTVIRLRNTVNVPRNTITQPLLYDSPDKFGSDKTLAVSRAQFPTLVGTGGGSVISSAVEVRDTRYYGTSYTAPVGTDTANATQGTAQSMFSYSAFYVQAFLDNTRVQIDANRDGDYLDADDRDVVLSQGQTVVSGAGVLAGGRVLADKPVQVELLTGQRSGQYASRTYALFADAQAANDYFTPVGFGGPGDTADDDDVRLYVFNPNATSIDVRQEGSGGTVTTKPVAAGTGTFFDVTADTGTRLFSLGGQPFLAAGVHDGPGGDTATTHDWGFSLQPKAALSQIAVVGLGVGNSNNPPEDGNNTSPVFVTALVPGTQPNTTIHVDYNNDGTVDETFTVTNLQALRLRDTLVGADGDDDDDNSGMRIFTTDGTLISVAWGEDGTAPDGSPGLDAGTTVPAVAVPEYFKFSTFAPGGDVNGDGLFNEGDTVRYSLRIRHIGTQPINSGVITDALPTAQVTYVPGSTRLNDNGTISTITDDGSGTAFPLDGTGYTVNNIDPGDTIVVSFDAVINTGLPPGFNFILNQSVLRYDIFELPANDVIDLRGTVGDRVWYDVDGDGVQDAGEPGLAGATVTLTWLGADGVAGGGDDLTFTTTTGANGIYSITNLPAGNFTTGVSNLPFGLTAQTFGVGSFSLPSGQATRSDIDFGYRGTGSVGDFVWLDGNNNGVQDAGEPGLAGAAVSLTWAGFNGTFGDADDITYPTVTTTATAPGVANYGFGNLPSGSFRATFTPPTGGSIVAQDQGGNDATDSDADPATGVTATLALAAGAANATVDAGMRLNSDLQITKTDGSTTVVPGQTVTYTITVTNAGPSAVTGATIADGVPAVLTGVTWTSATAGGAAVTAGATGTGNTLSATADLPVGATVTFTVTGTLDAAFTGTLSNTATVTPPTGTTDPTPGNNTATDTSTADPRADLQITKTDGATTVVPGQTVTYTITVTNVGPSAVTGATVADTLPAALTGVSWTSAAAGGAGVTAGATGSGNSLSSTVNLPVGATVTYTVTGTLNPAFAGTLSNTATVTAPGGVTDPTPGNNTATDTSTVTPTADLQVTKTDGSATVVPGQTVTYTIVVTNAGPSAVTGATIADTLPGVLTGVTWSSSTSAGATVTAGATGSGNSLNATADLAPGATVTFTVTGTLNPAFAGTLSNTATVTPPGGVTDPTPGNNTATDTSSAAPSADLTVTKSDGGATAVPGGLVMYTITVTNTGPSASGTITLTDAVPANTAFDSASDGGTLSNGTVTWTLPSLAAGASTSVTVTLRVNGTVPAGVVQIANSASATGAAPDPTPGNNTGTDTTPLAAAPDLRVVKDDGLTAVAPGALVTYTLTVSNVGNQDATGVLLSETVPANAVFVAAGSSGGWNAAGTSLSVGNLAAGQSLTFTYQVRVNSTVPAGVTQLVNTATVADDGSNGADPTPGDNSATDTDTIGAAPDLRVLKDDGGVTVAPGGLVTYTITVFNDGNQDATGVTLSETVPANTTFVAAGSSGGWNAAGTSLTVGSLAAGASAVFTYQVRVNDPFPVGLALVSNTVTVADDGTNGTDPTPGNNTAADTTPVPNGRIGDRVFLDRDGDGVQDGGELGVPGITVRLLDAGGSEVVSTVTDANGDYLFQNLPAGTYTVAFGNTDGTQTYTFTAANLGGDDALDSDANAAGLSPAVTLTDGQQTADVDAGVYVPVTIGDTVYYDVNADGTQTAGEPGVPGATVLLFYAGPDGGFDPADLSAAYKTATTGPAGSYSFAGLPPGAYRVAVVPNQSALNSSGLTTATTATTQPTTLLSGQSDLARDFGFTGTGSIGDTVWLDRDGNGSQGADEPGLAGIPVTVTWLGFDGRPGGGDDVTYPAVATGANGGYTVTGLPLGKFVVSVNPAGSNLVGTFDADGGADNTAVITLTAAVPSTTAADFGLRGTASIGDLVFQDVDRDGLFDAGELGLPNAAVTLVWAGADGLLDTADDRTFSTITDANGGYTFTGLPVFGETDPYRVTVTPPTAGYTPTGDLDGVNTPNTADLVLGPTDARTDADFALGGTAGQAVAGSVYQDLDGDGTRDAGEPGLPGVTVRLTGTDPAGRPIVDPVTGQAFFETTTGSDGTYRFDALLPGTYAVSEPVQPAAYNDGLDAAGSLGGAAGNDVVTGIVIAAGSDGTGYDFGETGVTVSGTVFRDDDRDGSPDAGEPGVAGVTVQLRDAAGNPVADPATGQPFQTVTGADGGYSFTNVPLGTYQIVETQPAGYADGPVGPATVRPVTVPPGGLTDQNFAEVLGSVGGTAYIDRNANAIRETGEAGLPGVTVTLTGTDLLGRPVSLTTTTDANGRYTFDNLFPADAAGYTISEGPVPTLTDGGPNAPGTAGGTAAGPNQFVGVAPAAGQQATGYDFGEVGTTVSGAVFVDADRDGARDPGETPLPGVTVTLLDSAGAVVATAVTGADGAYSFPNVLPGSYTVTETQPAGYGDPASGPAAPNSQPVSVTNVPVTGILFGDTLGSVSGTVYVDRNADAVQDVNEAGLPGVTVTLTGTDLFGQPVNLTTTTDASGRYTFDGLLPAGVGGYTVTEGPVPTLNDGGANAIGTAGGATAGPNTFIGVAPTAGQQATGYDFGEVGTTVSGAVFVDADRDGTRDPGEVPLPGVTVQLLDSTGAVVGTAVTGADGAYSFANVLPGAYTVREVQPTGYGDPPAGPAAPNSRPVTVTNVPVTDVEYGDTLTLIAGSVYIDLNLNAARDPNEPGLPGVTVTLTGTDLFGTPVTRTATTDADGRFVFDGLLPAGPGGYTLSEGPVPTLNDGQPNAAGTAGGAAAGPNQFGGVAPAAGTPAGGYNFGEVGVPVGGLVFVDADQDGTRDPGEAPLPGVLIELLDAAGTVVASATTGADGSYLFPNVLPGSYTLRETQPADFGNPAAGPAAPNTRPLAITNIPVTGVEFGNTPGSVGGVVYFDSNRNGRRDPGEPGLAGVTVTLTGTDQNGQPVSRTLTTAADGSYRFTDLRPGTYTLTETQPAGLGQGSNAVGTAGGRQTATDVLGQITLQPGVIATDYQFGERTFAPQEQPALPPLPPPPAVPPVIDLSKRMFLASTPPAPTPPPATGRTVPDFNALGSVSDARNPVFIATAEGATGDTVRVFDLTAGSERFRLVPFPGNPGGARVAVADLTGDGIPDVVAAAGPGGAPRVIAYDGNSGAVLFDYLAFEVGFAGGLYVAAGDIDGDGRADVVVTPDVGGGPRAKVLAGGDPARVLADLFAIDDPNFRGGVRPAVGDLNGDGRADLAVGAGVGGGPRVAVWDGRTLTAGSPARLMNDFFAFEPGLRNGVFLALGDIDGDGRSDLIAGAGPGGAPRVVGFEAQSVLSNTPRVVSSFFAGDTADRGGVPVAAVDVDGDGRAEVLTGAGAGSLPMARFTDPRTGRVLDAFAAEYMDFLGGVSVG